MSRYQEILKTLEAEPRSWLVTGAAGFIGSNLVERLLLCGQTVVGLDNFSTGHQRNLHDIREQVGEGAWARFRLIEGTIEDLGTCRMACEGIDYVLHQAALGSVPRSIAEPIATNAANVTGFLSILIAARDAHVKRFVYAASSSTYGDHPALPKVEDQIGKPLSPYAVTKYVNELYASVFTRTYGIETIGLRYFNVFGRRQDPDGAYAAVIPRWIATLLGNQPCVINGDGETSRDFCFVENAVQANILAATADGAGTGAEIYNVAVGHRTSLNQLFRLIRDGLAEFVPDLATAEPEYRGFRDGDVRHSQANVDKARDHLGYEPTHSLADGLGEALLWYVEDANRRASSLTGEPA